MADSLVALRDRREQVISRLSESYADDLFDVDELDFRDASLGPGVTTIHVRVFMGNFEVVLPPNLAIDVDVSSFAGNVTERHRVPPEVDPSRPQIRIVGTVRFGNLEITTRLPGETARDAIRREKRERKQLREAETKALPPGRHS